MPKLLANGVSSQSRSERYHSSGLWALKAKNGGKWPAAKAATVPAPRSTTVVKDTKKSGKRTVVRPRAARRFSEVPETRKSKRTPKVPTLRPSIVPGRVAIIVSGKYQGHRVIVLKALPSGLVVVAGPTSLSGVPLRRVSPAYLIATSVQVDLASAKAILDQNKDSINDALFARERGRNLKTARKQLTAEERKALVEKKAAAQKEGDSKKAKKIKVILRQPRKSVNFKKLRPATKDKLSAISEKQKQKLSIQKALDKVLVAEVKKTPLLREYFRGRFQLRARQYPHNLKF